MRAPSWCASTAGGVVFVPGAAGGFSKTQTSAAPPAQRALIRVRGSRPRSTFVHAPLSQRQRALPLDAHSAPLSAVEIA